MKQLASLLLSLLITTNALAQEGCPEYGRLMKEAEEYSTHREYRKALYKYNSAKTCSPAKRRAIDERINILFEKIENEKRIAEAAKTKMKKAMDKAADLENKADSLEIQKNNADSNRIVEGFKNKNNIWLNKMPDEEQDKMTKYIIKLNKSGKYLESDSLSSSLRLLYDAKAYDDDMMAYSNKSMATVKRKRFWEIKTDAIKDYYRLRAMDIIYYTALKEIKQATNLLPQYTKEYERLFLPISDSLNKHRKAFINNFLLPDTLMALPKALFSEPCSDNDNFAWMYTDYSNYRKTQVKFVNLSVKDFSFTADSSILLTDTGRFSKILAVAGNNQYKVGKVVDYSLKKNMIDFKELKYALPATIGLMDNKGTIIQNFSQDSLSVFLFSPDSKFLVTWGSKAKLSLFNIDAHKFIDLPNNIFVPTISFSSDAKIIAYYNQSTKLIYFANMEGRILNQFPSKLTGITNITNIDFTGNDRFLKIDNDDSICLFDIKNKKVFLNYDKVFVRDIIVAPNEKNILITCNTEYESSDNTYHGFLAFYVDIDLNIKAKLYSNCSHYFFTPNGECIIGYDDGSIMKWNLTSTKGGGNNFQTCLNINELIDNDCFSFDSFMEIEDASQIEKGARKYKDVADEQTDPIIKGLYYRQSQILFDRLAYGNAKHVNKERIPLFYDWYNWIDNKLGSRNFRDQFIREQAAVKIFDDFVNSPDSIYPQQLYYAADGHYKLAKLYDSLGAYNNDYIDQIKEEIVLRHAVFLKDADNADNIFYYMHSFTRLSSVLDSIGIMDLKNKRYLERLNMFKVQVSFLEEKIKLLPDSFDIKTNYIRALSQLGPSFLFVYVSNPNENANALDSALFYADKGLALSPEDRYDSAKLLIVKARAYILMNNGLEKAKALFSLVKERFPEFTKENMLRVLTYLKDAGAQNNKNIQLIENFIKQEDEKINSQAKPYPLKDKPTIEKH